jgi:hypothetical protein
MPAKKTPRVAEAAPTYKAVSRKSPRRQSRTSRARKPTSGEALWAFVLSLPEAERQAFFSAMFNDPEWREHIIDGISIFEAKTEKGRPLEEYLAERAKRSKPTK